MPASQLAYHLRVNKFIDRRLFVEALSVVDHIKPLSEYGYVSMGGTFLEDFRLLHQEFGLRKMYSFDGSANVLSRQEINKPYGFIRCDVKTSREIAEHFGVVRGTHFGNDSNAVIWLDYTAPSERKAQLIDVEMLCGQLISGDLVRVTMNANRSSLGSADEHNRLRDKGNTEHATLWAYRNAKLVASLGEQLPPDRNDGEFLESAEAFAETLFRSIKRAALKGVAAREHFHLEPILSVAYSDGQEMITSLFIAISGDDKDAFVQSPHWAKWPYKPGDEWDQIVSVRVPHLSIRERQLVHSTMAPVGPPNISGVGFVLDDNPEESNELFEQYFRHYLRYPTFAPLDVL